MDFDEKYRLLEPKEDEGVKDIQSPAAPKNEESPGEFTLMFQSPVAPVETRPKTAAPPVPPPEAGPGEFTRMFRSTVAPPVPPQSQVPQQEPGPGEFTQLFRSAPASSEPAPIPQSAAGQGEFTRIFGGRTVPSGPSDEPKFEAGGTPAISPARQGITPPVNQEPSPGEYTRIFGVQAATPVEQSFPVPPAAPAAAPPTPAAAPVQTEVPVAPAAAKSILPLVLTGIIFFLLAVIAVLIIMMKN